jgi:predicted  nucleic acid-binding Zn-ribbon protein
MSRAAALLQLQGIDVELDGYRTRLQSIEAALGDDPAVRDAQRKLVGVQAQVQAAQIAVQNLEFDGQNLGAKIAEVGDRMYSGAVSSPKELQDLQQEQASLQRRRQALEEKQFEALVAAEAEEVQQAALQQRLQQSEAEAAQVHGNLLEERLRLQAMVQRLQTGRDATVTTILPADLPIYERLRNSKRGRAVSQLDEGACTACGVAPSSSRIQDARQGNDLILCGNCGRILCAD